MTSYFVIGNCHLNGLLRSVKYMAPSARVDGCALWGFAERFADEEGFFAHVGTFDVVFTQHFPRGTWRELDSAAIAARHPNVILFPTVTFAAFHPDVTYVFRRPFTGEFLPSPLGPYSSALAYYGFLKGYPVDRTVALFREDVFAELGYFSAWQPSVDALLAEPEAKAYGFEAHLVSWARQGCFMYNPQHPRLGPITDIAREMLRRSGYVSPHGRPAEYLADDLQAGHIWPVYPEIGRYYGLAGTTYSFKRDPAMGKTPEVLGLHEFVAESFEGFRSHDVEGFYCERVSQWLDRDYPF